MNLITRSASIQTHILHRSNYTKSEHFGYIDNGTNIIHNIRKIIHKKKKVHAINKKKKKKVHATNKKKRVHAINKKVKLRKNTIKDDVLQIDGLKIDEFITKSPHCDHSTYNENVLLFDVVSLHSVSELHLMVIRIFELCEFVDLFIINEIMYYPDGKRRNESFWMQKDKYIDISTMLKQECISKIVHHRIYENPHLEGKQAGMKKGDQLNRIYFDTIRRNYQRKTVFMNCFKYFGHKCHEGNMHNMFMIASDLDEIPRNKVAKLIKKCDLTQIHTPIMADDWWHAYDFGCHLGKFEQRRIKIVSLNYLSSDVKFIRFDAEGLRAGVEDFQKTNNITNITRITKGGWHLTYFGDVSDIIEKNQHKAHIFFHAGKWMDVKYQQCQYEICSYYYHGTHSYRVPFVNQSDEYYPLLVTAHLAQDKLSPFLNHLIDINPNLYHKWLQYMKKTKINNAKAQEQYCGGKKRKKKKKRNKKKRKKKKKKRKKRMKMYK